MNHGRVPIALWTVKNFWEPRSLPPSHEMWRLVCDVSSVRRNVAVSIHGVSWTHWGYPMPMDTHRGLGKIRFLFIGIAYREGVDSFCFGRCHGPLTVWFLVGCWQYSMYVSQCAWGVCCGFGGLQGSRSRSCCVYLSIPPYTLWSVVVLLCTCRFRAVCFESDLVLFFVPRRMGVYVAW